MIRLINLLILISLSTTLYSAEWTGDIEFSPNHSFNGYSVTFTKAGETKYNSCEHFFSDYNIFVKENYAKYIGLTPPVYKYDYMIYDSLRHRFICYAVGGASYTFHAGAVECQKGLKSTGFFESIPDVTVCLGREYGNLAGCEADLTTLEVLKTKHLGKYSSYGKYTTNGRRCNFSTKSGAGGGGYTVPPKNICDNKAVCEVSSPNDCPSGYGSGTFNGKTICVIKTPSNPNPTEMPKEDPLNPPIKDTTPPPTDNTTTPPTDNTTPPTNSGGSTGGSGSTGSSGGTTGGIGSTGSNDGSATGGTGSTGSNGGTTSGTGSTGSGNGSTTGDGNGNGDGDGNGLLDFFKGFFADDPNAYGDGDTALNIPVPDTPKPNTNFNFGGGTCPVPLTVPYNIAGATGTLEFTWDYLCKLCEILRPIVIAISMFLGAVIVSGTRSTS